MWSDENGGFRIRWCHKLYTTNITHAPWGLLSFLHCIAFSPWGAKTIRIRYVWTRIIFLKNGGQIFSVFKVSDTCGRGLNLLLFLPFSWRHRRRCLRSPLSFLLIISTLLSPKCAWWTSTHTFTSYLPLFRNTHAHSEVFRLQKHHNLIKYFRCHYIQNTISLLYKELKGPWCHRDLHCEILKEEHFTKNSVSNISSLCHRLLDTVQRYTIYHTEQKLLAHDETRNLFAIFRVAFRSGRMLEL